MEKIIHQTWTTNELSSDQTQWVDSVKRCHPNYKHILWTREKNYQFINDVYPEFSSFYYTLNMIEQYDFVRPLYIFKYGGIYLDIDIIMKKSLDDVLIDADVFLCDSAKGFYDGRLPFIIIDSFFYAGEKDNPFFYNLCKSMSDGLIYKLLSINGKESRMNEYLYKIGAFMLTKFYLLNKDKYRIKVLDGVIENKPAVDKGRNYSHGIHLIKSAWYDRVNNKFIV
jgi:hypothetical protein